MLKHELFEGLDLVFLDNHFVGIASDVTALQKDGMQFSICDGAVIGLRGNSYYALCDGSKFTIGSTCTKKDIHYTADSFDGFLTSMSSRYNSIIRCNTGAFTEVGMKPYSPGKGEWVASTQSDALEMATQYQKEWQHVALARAIAYSTKHSSILQAGTLSIMDNARHRLPKLISVVYESGLVVVDRATQLMLDTYGISDGSEICMRYSASRNIGRLIAVRGQLESYFTKKVYPIDTSVPITITMPSDYPVFIG